MYKYKRASRKIPTPPKDVQRRIPEEEFLTGEVMGKNAAKGEERLFRAFGNDKRVKGVIFRMITNAPRGFPGSQELDFLVQTVGDYYAVSVKDNTFVHAGNMKDAKDLWVEERQRDWLKQKGINIRGIIPVDARSLMTQEDANRVERELIRA